MYSRIQKSVLIRRQAGFTLLELSIVLVIVGLLAGGIFAGATLIRSMELKTIQGEASEYRTGIAAFRDRYHAYPGDMSNATQIWGEVGDTDGSLACPNDIGSGTETCDGNGNQQIAPTKDTLAESEVDEYESFRAWQHLANSGLSTGSELTGVRAMSWDRSTVVGQNVPRSKFDKAAGWTIFYIPYGADEYYGNCRKISASGGLERIFCKLSAGNSNWFFMEREYGNIMTIGAELENINAVKPILTPQDADTIDSKFDDGLPGSGSIMAIGDYAPDSNTIPDCFEPSDPTGAVYTTNFDYSINEREKGCSLIFTID